MTGSFNYPVIIILTWSLSIFSCKHHLKVYGDPVIDPTHILKNQSNFSLYWYQKLRLSDAFIALDTASFKISKKEFLQQVSTGRFLPVLLKSDTPIYKLFKINAKTDEWITSSLKSIGRKEYEQYLWEGKSIPDLDLIDLTGSIYNNKNTKGKLLVINFWFIGCAPCVKEIPDLNMLVKEYEKRSDVLFLSIAPDKEKQLIEFLIRTPFDYGVVSDTISQLANSIGVLSFPTHMVVNKEGKIVKILNGYRNDLLDKLETILKNELL